METPIFPSSPLRAHSNGYTTEYAKPHANPEYSQPAFTPASPSARRKKVTMYSKSRQVESENTTGLVTPIREHATRESLCATPIKLIPKVGERIDGSAKTLKKGRSFQNETLSVISTMNKNRHSSKIGGSVQKQDAVRGCQAILRGKRRHCMDFNQAEMDEADNMVKETQEEKKDSQSQDSFGAFKQIKPNMSQKSNNSVDKIYFFTEREEKLRYFPVYQDKDLGYSRFIQATTRELEVDNDCLTDSEVFENAKEWTIDDLMEGIKGHFKEVEDEMEIVSHVNKLND